MRKTFLPFALLSLIHITLAQDKQPKQVISKDPLTAEQIAIYRAVLNDYVKGDDVKLNIADRTQPLDAEARACLKGTKSAVSSDKNPVVHKLDPAILLNARMVLVDPEKQSKTVEQNDPDHLITGALKDGQPVSDKGIEQSVKQAFATGLFTLSEIAFDKSQMHAVLQYSFYCGGLCGHGSTVLLSKVNGVWKVTGSCGYWIS